MRKEKKQKEGRGIHIDQLLFGLKRPLCVLALISVFLSLVYVWLEEEESILEEGHLVYCSGQVVDKSYKEGNTSQYWQIILQDVWLIKEPPKNKQTSDQSAATEAAALDENNVNLAEKDAALNEKKAALAEKKALQRLEGKRVICNLAKGEPEPVIGEQLILEGRVEIWEKASNPGQFDVGRWYRTQGIFLQLKNTKVLWTEEERDTEPKQNQSKETLAWKTLFGIKDKKNNGYLPNWRYLKEGFWQFRQKGIEMLKSCLGEEDGAIIGAMVLGEKSNLSQDIKGLYQRNGISHILSISGLHLMLLGMGVYNGLKRLSVRHFVAIPLSIFFMAGYCLFTGNSVSTVRATLMFSVMLMAKLLGRSYDSLSALGLAAILQLFFHPWSIMDSGFQLSYLAVLGVSAVVPRLNQIFSLKHKLAKSIMVSIGVSLTTLPILLDQFGTYPWHSIVLNLLIVPPMAFLLWLSIFLLVLGNVFSLTAFPCLVVSGMIKAVLWYYEGCCRVAQQLPIRNGYQGKPLAVCMGIYGIGVLFFLIMPFKKWQKEKVFLGLLLSVLSLSFKSNQGMEVTMLDVGQGDGLVIRSERGRVYLFDCGSTSVNNVGIYRLLPFLKTKGYGKIEGIFISHLDKDHDQGIMELLEVAKEERIEIEYLFLAKGLSDSEKSEKLDELLDLAKAIDLTVVYLQAGDSIQDGEVKFSCLHPGKGGSDGGNNGSLVLLVRYGEFSLLLTGDVEKAGEEEILAGSQWITGEKLTQKGEYSVVDEAYEERTAIPQKKGLDEEVGEEGLRCDVLKVAHHGASGSSSKKFLQVVKPKVSLISCGLKNPYGHPAKDTLERLDDMGSVVLQTWEYGAITIKAKADGRFTVEGYCVPE